MMFAVRLVIDEISGPIPRNMRAMTLTLTGADLEEAKRRYDRVVRAQAEIWTDDDVEGGPVTDFGEVVLAVFRCIAERHGLSLDDVIARAKAIDFDEDLAWRETLGYAVDQIDDELQREEMWPSDEDDEEVPSE